MLRPRLWVASAMLCITFAAARGEEEGGFWGRERLTLTKSYVQLDELSRSASPRPNNDAAKNQRDFECLKIVYLSDGLRIAGFIYKPKHIDGGKLPGIIFNRAATSTT